MSGINCSIAGATYAPAVVNTAVSFDGNEDYYSATGLTTTATDGKYMTFAFTFYLPSSATGKFMDILAIELGGGSGQIGYFAVLQSTRLHNYFINSAGGTGQTYGDFEITTSNAWHQIVYYHDATSFANCKYYVDGVDRTSSSLLNGASFGEPNMQNVDFNWGATGAKVYIGNGIIGTGFDASDEFDGRLSQVYLHNASGAPDIGKFWNSTSGLPQDLGTNGTATGLAQPLIYHYGDTATFPTNNGTGFNSYTLSANGGVASAAGPTYGIYSPPWTVYTQSTSETQANGIFDGQVAVMGYNSDGTIRAAYTGNSTGSSQGFIKPILFNPTTNAITFGTKVDCMTMGASTMYGLKTVSETEYSIGTANATNFGITFIPANSGPSTANSVYPFSMDSSGAVTVGTSAYLGQTGLYGTINRPSDLAFDGLYSGVPKYVMWTRENGNDQFALSRSSTTLSLQRSNNTGLEADGRATIVGSFAGVNDASALCVTDYGEIQAVTWGATTRTSAATASGLFGGGNKMDVVLITSGTSAKYMMYGRSGSSTMTSRIANVTYSASVAPTISLGSTLYEENAGVRTMETSRLVKSWNSNQAFLFFIESNVLKVKIATVSGDTISWGTAATVGAMTTTSFDIMPAYVDSNNQYFMGVYYDSGNATAFAIKYVP